MAENDPLSGKLLDDEDGSIHYEDAVLRDDDVEPLTTGTIIANTATAGGGDVLMDLYRFVESSSHNKDNNNNRKDVDGGLLQQHHHHHLHVGDVIRCLEREGILFWRDERFYESQVVALRLCSSQEEEEEEAPPAVPKKVKVLVSDNAVKKKREAAALVNMDYTTFTQLVSPCASLFLKAFSEGHVVPNWNTFTTDMEYHFDQVAPIKDGENAQYIPALRDADPEQWGLSICSIDGQRFSIGDASNIHTIQSVSKPVTLALGLASKDGPDFMRQWIDVEPAGRPFNTQDLDPNTNRPFNSSINSGAIMSAGCFASAFPNENWRQVVDRVRATWQKLCGNDLEIGFSEETFVSEKKCAFNNFAIAYNLKGRKGLPRDIDLHKMLNVYLGCCSIEITAEGLSVAAATLANGGVCPITGKEVFPADVVRSVLAETMVCGMYNQAGIFAVEVGLPAKSGVSGALMVIVPNVFGFATFSPRLNSFGNSRRGFEFCKRLVNSYRVHSFEPLRSGNTGAKIDPRHNGMQEEQLEISRIAWAVQVGDVNACRVRDLFLFSLCQTAAVSPEGLCENALDAIKQSHEQIFQSCVDDKVLLDISSLVKRTPRELKIMEDLTVGLQITDSMRSLIVMAILDIVMLDGKADEEEREILVRIGRLLGIDKDVILMELNRYEHHVGHRFQELNYCNMLSSFSMSADLSARSVNSARSGLCGGIRRGNSRPVVPSELRPSKTKSALIGNDPRSSLARTLSRSSSGRASFAVMRAQLLSTSKESFSSISPSKRPSFSITSTGRSLPDSDSK